MTHGSVLWVEVPFCETTTFVCSKTVDHCQHSVFHTRVYNNERLCHSIRNHKQLLPPHNVTSARAWPDRLSCDSTRSLGLLLCLLVFLYFYSTCSTCVTAETCWFAHTTWNLLLPNTEWWRVEVNKCPTGLLYTSGLQQWPTVHFFFFFFLLKKKKNYSHSGTSFVYLYIPITKGSIVLWLTDIPVQGKTTISWREAEVPQKGG